MSNTKPTPEHDFEVAKLQKQVEDILEKYRQEKIPVYKEPEGDPSF
tara:strand:+ start:11404 stop:11541 length:138 start_codon:yes stop_codon:yes gene_type:complete